jgi:hypothetical protein
MNVVWKSRGKAITLTPDSLSSSGGNARGNEINFSEIDRARQRLGLGEAATLREIKSAYRRLAHRHHPDKHDSAGDSNDVMKDLNRAYKLLVDYCNEYRYGFRREDVSRAYPEEDIETWRDRWSDSI